MSDRNPGQLDSRRSAFSVASKSVCQGLWSAKQQPSDMATSSLEPVCVKSRGKWECFVCPNKKSGWEIIWDYMDGAKGETGPVAAREGASRAA